MRLLNIGGHVTFDAKEKSMKLELLIDDNCKIIIRNTRNNIYSPSDGLLSVLINNRQYRIVQMPMEDLLFELYTTLGAIAKLEPLSKDMAGTVFFKCHKSFDIDDEIYDKLSAYSWLDGIRTGAFLYPVDTRRYVIEFYLICHNSYEQYYKKRNVKLLDCFEIEKGVIDGWVLLMKNKLDFNYTCQKSVSG